MIQGAHASIYDQSENHLSREKLFLAQSGHRVFFMQTLCGA
jgi:hypothetical protein